MAFILQDEMPHTADIFIDDLPIKGPLTEYLDENGVPEVLKENPGIRRFIWEHACDVHRIMHRVGHAGGTFSPSKVQLARREVVIVGHKCTSEGRIPDPNKIEKVLNWPILTTVKEVRGFLGLCGTVRIWIKNYSAMARPLTELIRHDTDFEWDDRRQEAFDNLKMLITSAPALKPIDYSSDLPVVLSVDSSYIAVGFILSQRDEQGHKRPARYGSIPMNEREARYSQPKLELYGLFRALRAYRLYLVGVKKLQVEVDAKYIKGMLNEPDLQPNASVNRWIQGILLFDFELIHIPAERHKGPDALSRRGLGEGEEVKEEDDAWLDEIALYTLPHEVTLDNDAFQDYNPLKLIPVYISTDSKQDQTMRQIHKFLSTLETPEFLSLQERKRFITKASRFFIRNGNMYRRAGQRPPLKVIFSANKRLSILESAHEGQGHRGEYAVMRMLKERFYWPNMWNDVHQHVRSCHQCQLRSTRKVEVPLTISAPVTLFTKIYLDIMFMPKAKGFKYIIAARDDLSRAAEGRALRDATSHAIAKFLWEEIFCRYVERGHAIIRESIVKACDGKVKDWPDYVPHAFFADKITISRSTGFSPYYLLFGVHPVLPFDLLEASFLVEGFHSGMSTTDLLALRIQQLSKKDQDLEKAAEVLAKTRLRSKAQFEKKFEHRIRVESFKPGDLVLVRNTAIERSLNRKTKPRYLGPYEVVRRTFKGAYIVKELNGNLWKQGIAAFRLLPYISRDDSRLQDLAGRIEEIGRPSQKHITEFSDLDSSDSSEESTSNLEDVFYEHISNH
ncbi:unnamed protein product [Somion occarium]|uniref:Uncharacterized protein n=1 Tax=Somion occarium TaxID=3059160 RepID=A0ABP1DZL9_9APHY